MNKKELSKFAITELSKEEIHIRAAFLAKLPIEKRFELVLDALTKSRKAKKLAAVALGLLKSNLPRKGRPVLSVADFARNKQFAIEVELLVQKENIRAVDAIKIISKKPNTPSEEALEKLYYKNKRSVEIAVRTIVPPIKTKK